jgi:hypothetical protein
MNKKFISIAASLLLAVPMTVAAAPSPTQDTTIETTDDEVRVTTNKDELSTSPSPLVWVEDASSADTDVKVKAKVDPSKILQGATPHVAFDVTCNNPAAVLHKNVTLTVNLSKAIPTGKVGVMYHVHKNGDVSLVAQNIPAGAQSVVITVNTADLSPFIVYVGDKMLTDGSGSGTSKPTPNTSDSNKSVLWGSIAMISLACAAGIVVAKRRNA